MLTLLVVFAIIVEISMLYFLKRSVEKRLDRVRQEWENFVTRPDEKTPSRLELWIAQTSIHVSHDIGTTVMASFRGGLGGVAKGINAEIAEGLAESDPNLAILNEIAPKQFKKLAKNPMVINGLQGILGGMSKGGQTAAIPSNGNGHTSGGNAAGFGFG